MSWLTEPDSEWDSSDPEAEPPRSRLRLVALLLGAWLAVSLIVLLVLLVVGGHHGNGRLRRTPPTRRTPALAAAGSSHSAGALPSGWKQQAADDQTNCAAHSYGQVAAFFARTPAASVHRLLATTSDDGRAIVIASNVVSFANEAQAKSYLTLVNADGTGNIADLLREGVRYPGGPAALPPAAFASGPGRLVRARAEAGYVTGTSSADDPTLQAVARRASDGRCKPSDRRRSGLEIGGEPAQLAHQPDPVGVVQPGGAADLRRDVAGLGAASPGPSLVRTTLTARSSSSRRARDTRPACSRRLTNGERVFDSSCSR